MADEIITIDCPSHDDEEDAEYKALVKRLEETFPPCSQKGFDFSQIQGNIAGRTAKAIVLHLSFHGWSVAQIAEAIDCPIRAVGHYLADAIQEASPIVDVEILRDFEMRKLDEQAKVCWEQFLRSCEDAVTVTEHLDKDGNVVPLKTIKPQSGNPAYHRILTEISKRRAALQGLDKPTKISVDKTERKLQITEVVVQNRDQVLAAKAAGLLE